MAYSNRELVESFLMYKLSQKYNPSAPRPEEGDEDGGDRRGSRDGLGAVLAALRDSSHEFELRFAQAFAALALELEITPETAYHSFKSVMDDVFQDGVNWGRIVALFAFGGELCLECREKNMVEQVLRVADWMTRYLDEHIDPWIQIHGGWDNFAKIFGREADDDTGRNDPETLRKWLIIGLGLLTGVLISIFYARKL